MKPFNRVQTSNKFYIEFRVRQNYLKPSNSVQTINCKR